MRSSNPSTSPNSMPLAQKLAPKLAMASLMAAALSSCLTPPSSFKQPDTAPGGSSAPGMTANFVVNSINAGEGSTIGVDSWGFPKKRHLSMSACIGDAPTLGPIIQQPFTVSDGVSSKTIQSDIHGCLLWTETHDFDYLAPETFVSMPRTITAAGPYKGSVTVQLAYNPWGGGGGSVVDLRTNTVPAIDSASRLLPFDGPVTTSRSSALSAPTGAKVKGAPEKPALLKLDNIGFDFNGLNYGAYEIDRDLNLTVAHNYTVHFSPTIKRKTLSQQWATESPQTGKLRVSFIVATEQKAPDSAPALSDVLVAESRVVELNFGAINESFTIKLPDIARLAGRSTIYVEVEPMIESPSLGRASFSGPIAPLMQSAGSNLLPSPISASQLFAQMTEARAKVVKGKLSPYAAFKTASGLNTVELGDLSQSADTYKTVALTRNEIEAWIAHSLNLEQQTITTRKLCFLAYPSAKDAAQLRAKFEQEAKTRGFTKLSVGTDLVSIYTPDRESPLKACLQHPEKFLAVNVREFAEQILSPTPTRVGAVQPMTFSVNASTSISSSSSASRGTSASAKADVGANLGLAFSGSTPVVPFSGGISASASIGKEWFRSWSRTRSTNVGISAGASRSLVLSAEANTFRIDLMARRCALVAPAKGLSANAPTDVTDASFAPMSFCSGTLVHKQQNETYYLISQNGGSSGSAFSDSLDLADSPYRMFIRGQQVYELFKRIAEDPQMELVYEREASIQPDLVPELPSTRLTQEAPGLLSLN